MNTSRLRVIIALVLCCLLNQIGASPSAPARLRCEGRLDPLGIDVIAPRFSWWVQDDSPGALQGAYQIEVRADGRLKWDSGKVEVADSVDVVYAGPPLVSGESCTWRVKTWNQAGEESPWSEAARFEMGLLEAIDWKARWIGHPPRFTHRSPPPVHLRREFRLVAPPSRARLYVSARGLFEVEINGRRIGNDVFAPGWTDYRKRNQYLTYDVTDALEKGNNAIGILLADGWHNGFLKDKLQRNWYGNDTSVIAQLVIESPDGKPVIIATDDSWRAATGPIIESDIYNGEKYDARAELGEWSRPGYESQQTWLSPRIESSETGKLVAKPCQPVRPVETLKAKSIHRAPDGEWIVDFGQNLVGVVRIHLTGRLSRTITLRHAEMLQSDGSLYLENLRSAEAVDRYTCKDSKPFAWQPRFTFHGFRYLGISGIDTPPPLDALEAVVLHTDVPPSGRFSCSHPLLNQLQSNIVWGQKGNYFEVPTDCPQRDERLGWTGDAQVFIRTATFNMNVAPFFEKWTTDMRDSQFADGQYPHFAPLIGTLRMTSSPAWADAGVICPWVIYERYGNTRILADNFEAMRRWVDYQHRTSKELIRPPGGFGDWLALGGATPSSLIGTAYFAHAADLLSRSAGVLGRSQEKKQYAELSKQVAVAFNREFMNADGTLKTPTQTGYLLALGFDLLPEAKRPAALKALLADLESHDWHLSTGFVGTGLLLPVLSKMGCNDIAYRILLKESYPGWLYSIKQGATTMWERWNSYTKKDGFGDAAMNSFNHYAYGAVGEWMYANIGGIDAAAPGFRKIRIRPEPGGGLTWAKASLDSPYGIIATDWKIDGDVFTLTATVPPNTTATIELPDGSSQEVGAGLHVFSSKF